MNRFLLFLVGQGMSAVGSGFTSVAMPLFVFQLTGSPASLGLATTFAFLPAVLFGVILGAVADRVDRRRTMVRVDLARGVVIACVPVATALGFGDIWLVYAVIFVQSTLEILFETSSFAIVPALVPRERFAAANSWMVSSLFSGRSLGAVVAGLLANSVPVSRLLVFDAVGFMLSVMTLIAIRGDFRPRHVDRPFRNLRADMATGLRYIWSEPRLRTLALVMALVNLLTPTLSAQLLVYARDRLSASDGQFGWLLAASGIGALLIVPAAPKLADRFDVLRSAAVILGTYGLSVIALTLATSFTAGFVLWTFSNGVRALYSALVATFRQRVIPDALRGRVASVSMTLAWSTIPVGSFAGGLVVTALGSVVPVFAAIGLLLVLVAAGFAAVISFGRWPRPGCPLYRDSPG